MRKRIWDELNGRFVTDPGVLKFNNDELTRDLLTALEFKDFGYVDVYQHVSDWVRVKRLELKARDGREGVTQEEALEACKVMYKAIMQTHFVLSDKDRPLAGITRAREIVGDAMIEVNSKHTKIAAFALGMPDWEKRGV
jgi:hypothetical protein